MRFFTPIVALFAAVAVAQTSSSPENAISIPNGGLSPTAGQSQTIQWTNPSSGTVTIKLQMGQDITPNSGVVLASGIQASALTATFQIPSDLVNSSDYTFEIIDESNPDNYNFSSPFAVSGATAVSSMVTSTASSSSSASSSASSSSSASESSSSSSSSSSASSSSSSASRTSSSSSSRTSSSATSTATTAVPNSNTNGASSLTIEGGLVALIAGALALF